MDDAGIDPASADYARRHGVLCARVRWTWGQVVVGGLALATLVAGLALAPHAAWLVLSTLMALLAAATLGLRLSAMAITAWRDPTIAIADADVAAADRATLPRYSVLVPLYREPEVVPHLLAALGALDYPLDRLDIQFLVEPDDGATGEALRAQALPPHMRITVSPVGMPRTKPRACNAGLALADGELLVIYDAEDRPEPDQLIKAALAYRDLPPDVVCLQCRLDHYNSQQSLPTRWTTIDYLMWFRLVLPGLQALGAPIPLGGTSNHFRIAALRELGGWDPFNVTEDCDLGLRIVRRGWRTSMLASSTWEEAVGGARGWVNQRSRWIKGYLQTWMVHSRSGAARAFGLRGGALMALSTLGLVGALLVNPLAWATVVLWLAIGWSVVDTRSALSMATLAVTVGLLLANLAVVGIAIGTCLRLGRRDLLGAAMLTPAAWAMQSAAAWKAAWEYLVRPFHWQKTRHGQAVHDTGAARARHSLGAALTGLILTVALLALAGQRIAADMARQAAARRPRPPPTQLALRYVPGESGAIGLIAADNPRRPPAWRVVDAAGAPTCSIPGPSPALRATADFPTTTLDLVSRAVRDLGPVAALALDVHVSPSAPDDLRAAVHWRDDDGCWFECLAEQRLIPGAWTRLEFPLHDPSAWRGLGHRRAWHDDLLRRVGELGISCFSALPYRGALTIANLRAVPFPAAERERRELPAFTELRSSGAEAPVMARWNLDFDLGRSWSNPFDPDEVAVDAEFTTPEGAIERVPAFYFQDYTRRLVDGREDLAAVGAPCWRVAYRARSPGPHPWRLLLSEHGGAGRQVAAGRFTATPHADPGYIRRSERRPELLAHDDGTFFYPIGQNLCHAVDLRPPLTYSFTTPPDQGSYTFDRYFARMAENGMNLARIWMTPWSYGLEGNAQWRHFQGPGRYSLANAWRLDHLLDQGERLGIAVLLTMTHQSEIQTQWGSDAWKDSALNRANGGCLQRPEDFFSSPEVMRLYRRRLRYIVARWGDRPNIAAWEFFGEANLMPGFDPDACARWHQELARYVRPLDLGRHLIFTHTHNWQEGHELWALPEIDCVQGNGYIRPPNTTTNHVVNFDRYLREVESYHKPVLVAEYGGRSELGAPSEDYLQGQLHSGLWASFVRPFAGTALHWWWNFTDGADLYGHYRGLARFAVGIDRLARDYRPVRPAVAGGDGQLLAAGMQERDSGFYWIHHPGIFENWLDVPTVTGASLRLRGLAPGRYRLEFWDTLTGEVILSREEAFGPDSAIALPAVPRDLALKVLRLLP